MATRIYGCIVEYGLQVGEMQTRIYDHNQKVLNQLPWDDKWPPLARKMFAITYNEEFPDSANYAYSGRIIHFGGNFKSIEHEWPEWRKKFETLLTKLLWLNADVHIETEYTRLQTSRWHVDLSKWTLYEKTDLIPIIPDYWEYSANHNFDEK